MVAFEEIRRGGSASGGIFPLSLGREAVAPAGLEGKPLAERLRRIVGHGDGGPVTHSPALVREAERRGRTADSIHVRAAVVGIYLLRRSPSFGHSLVVERPELAPGHLGFSHEERRHPYFPARPLVGGTAGLAVGTADRELSSRDSNHLDLGCRTGNRLLEVGKTGDCGRGIIHRTSTGVHHLALQPLVLVARHMMPCVQMAADTSQSKFGRVLFIIKVRGDPVVVYPLGIEIGVALQAGFVVDRALCVFQVPHRFPVYFFLGSRKLLPHVLGAGPGLDHVVPEKPVFRRREMAFGAGSDHPALAQEMLRFLPVCIGLLVVVAFHAVLSR